MIWSTLDMLANTKALTHTFLASANSSSVGQACLKAGKLPFKCLNSQLMTAAVFA